MDHTRQDHTEQLQPGVGQLLTACQAWTTLGRITLGMTTLSNGAPVGCWGLTPKCGLDQPDVCHVGPQYNSDNEPHMDLTHFSALHLPAC